MRDRRSGRFALAVQPDDEIGFTFTEVQFIDQTTDAGTLLDQADRMTVGLLIGLLIS